MSKIEKTIKEVLEQIDLDLEVKYKDGSPRGSYFGQNFYSAAGFDAPSFFALLARLKREGFIDWIGLDLGQSFGEERPEVWDVDSSLEDALEKYYKFFGHYLEVVNYRIFPTKDFLALYETYKSSTNATTGQQEGLKSLTKTTQESNEKFQGKKYLKSLHLLTRSLEPEDVIFLVVDEHYSIPIRFLVKNKYGQPTYIKKLYDIAYMVNVPNKKVPYTKRAADGINNGLFKKKSLKKYMLTNKLKKPTLVQKSEDGKLLVLKNDIEIRTGKIEHVPTQHKSFYIDKTR